MGFSWLGLTPYHQANGYCFERAEHSARSIQQLRQLPMAFDFNFEHQMGKTHYGNDWRPHVPEAFE